MTEEQNPAAAGSVSSGVREALEAEVAKWEYASRSSRTDAGSRMALPVALVCKAIVALATIQDKLEPLLAALSNVTPIKTYNTPDYAELTFGEHETQAMTMKPGDWNRVQAAYEALTKDTPR